VSGLAPRAADGPDVRGLFAGPVRVRAVTRFLDEEALLPEERRLVARAVAGRRSEFATGRACARALLAELGLAAGPLLRDADRVPLWPAGAVGSISHTRGRPADAEGSLCVVAVAPAAEVAAVGVDVEPDRELEPELWPRIATRRELAWLSGQPEGERGRLVRALFGVKECVYKAAFPRRRERWGFHDVEVELDPATSGFRARTPGGRTVPGRWLRTGGFLVVGVAEARLEMRPGEPG